MTRGQGEKREKRANDGDDTGAVLGPDDPLTRLRGVGLKLAATLCEAAGLRTVRELVSCFPRRHREMLELEAPAEEAIDQLVRLHVHVERTLLSWLPGRRSMVTVTARAGDGTPVEIRFFNQPYLKKTYGSGGRFVVEGILDLRGKRFAIKQGRLLAPDAATIGPCRLEYPEIPGVSPTRLAALIEQALERSDLQAWPVAALPRDLADEFPPYAEAVQSMHRPASIDDHERARRRFAVVEAVALFRRIERARRRRLGASGPAIPLDPAVEERIRARIPFALTSDQENALQHVFRQLRGKAPMGILMQGDVGTGKTAVAVGAALAALAQNYQVAFLAPTELLAEQHLASVQHWLRGSRVPVTLLTSSLDAAARRDVDAALSAGKPHLVFGTHALFSERTTFARLGLVIIDEQHRFGVEQRTTLVRKGDNPHVLYMTATPIPRTLTLTLFGDLDVTVLRQKPPGHHRVPAFFLPATDKGWRRILALITRRTARGQRVFVVCPKIGDDGDTGEKGGAIRLQQELSRHFDCRLVHGQMAVKVRQETLEAFRDGAFPVLVGTTVLEVGVDVPDATLMVIVGADRFGLATLHQLRGRVGRGRRRGICVLTGKPTPRTRAICRTTDGFELAEEDLILRGSGELMGRRQSGLSDLRALDPVSDLELLARVRDAVRVEGYDTQQLECQQHKGINASIPTKP